jgi:hypothetical protein
MFVAVCRIFPFKNNYSPQVTFLKELKKCFEMGETAMIDVLFLKCYSSF